MVSGPKRMNKVGTGRRTLPSRIASSSLRILAWSLSRALTGRGSYNVEPWRKSTVLSRVRFDSESGVVDEK